MSLSASPTNPPCTVPIVVAKFTSRASNEAGRALGKVEQTTWSSLIGEFQRRRTGIKDGANLVFARFTPEPDGRAHRVKEKLAARTAVALDCETHKETGEVPPSFSDIIARLNAHGFAAAIYTSHNHSADAPRYRIVLPLSAEIPHHLPAVEVMAELFGLVGVLDNTKLYAAALFYLPSAEKGQLANHHAAIIEGEPIGADWITEQGEALLAQREKVQAEHRAAVMLEAEKRREARLKSGKKDAENLIASIRDHLDLEGELMKHGYAKRSGKFLYPGSESGIPGVHIMTGNDGVERVYSHHSADPLAEGNLPTWCFSKAVDVVDVVAILDFGGNQKKALHELAKRFGIGEPLKTKPLPEEPPNFGDVPPPEESASRGKEEKRNAADVEWHDPVDFFQGETAGAPELKRHHIPDALWPFVTDTAERVGADPAAVAMCALVSCATVISDDWTVQPKRHDHTWTESARLWGAIVGEPSIKKSPILAAATKPIDELEKLSRKKHEQEMRAWRVEDAQAKLDKSPAPPQPKLERFMVEGSTPEALSEVLRDDAEAKMRAPGKKVLSRHGEMSEFFGGLDKYKAGGKGGSERGAYLRLYDGGRYSIDRVNRGSFGIPNWSACFLGAIQPGPIQRIARDSAEDGLLQRFMYVVPARQGQGVDRKPDNTGLARYAALFPALVGLHPAPAIGRDYVDPVVFHAGAHAHREAIDTLAEALAALPDTSPRLQAAFGKWSGLFARLCLTFHMIGIADHTVRGDKAPGPVRAVITEQIAHQVADYMRDIVLPHLLRADAVMFSTDQTGHAQWVAGFILARKMARITTRDIIMSYKALKAPEDRRTLHAVMQSLVAVNWLDPEEPSNPAKGITSWIVNPEVHHRYAERAKSEEARRAAAREQIARAAEMVRSSRQALAQAAE